MPAPTIRRTDAGQDGRVSRLGVPSAPREGRPGQGAHAQPRHPGDPGGRLGRGCDDHGRRRAVRGNDLAPHGPAFRRPRGRRRHRLREGGQPATEPAVALHRLRIHHRPGRGAARPERHGRPAVHGRRRPAAHPREPAGDRWRHRHQHARRGHLHHNQDPARRPARPVRG